MLERLIIFSLLVWGCFAIGQSHIFSLWRDFLDKLPWSWPSQLFNCSLCLSFWSGLFLSLLGNIFPSLDVSPLKGYENIPFNAILASGTAYLIQMARENYLKELEDDNEPIS